MTIGARVRDAAGNLRSKWCIAVVHDLDGKLDVDPQIWQRELDCARLDADKVIFELTECPILELLVLVAAER